MVIRSAETRLPVEEIQHCILNLRNEKVMLDKHLAILYGVETKVLLQAVKRNIQRFPSDFMFQLTADELEILRSQFVTSSWGGGVIYLMFLLSKELQCFPAFCIASKLFKLTLKLCVHLCNYEK